MPNATSLDARVRALVPEVDATLREDLLLALRTLREAGNPVGVVTGMSRLSLRLVGEILTRAGHEPPSQNLYDCIVTAAGGDPGRKTPGLHLLPDELASSLHTIRVLSNKADHAAERIAFTTDDAENALRLFLRVVEWFYGDYEFGPRLTTIYDPSRLRQFSQLGELVRTPTNVPVPPTPLIGRERELSEVLGLLHADGVSLVSLTGFGGSGKTRLALEVAAEVLDRFLEGVFFVDLSSITDATLVPSVVSGMLGLREEGARPLRDTLIDYLAPKTILLVLDNLEQIRPQDGAGRFIADLLARCQTLRVLATSRSALQIRAEREYPVRPLPTPDAQRVPELDQLARIPSVQLFLERAQAAKPTFQLSADNAQAIADICQRLDGLPLAIELAAARTRALAPGELARRLGNTLDLLSGRAADRPDRQQTLRGAIAWSYDLLQPEEQALFRRMSVFAGGCTLEAAEVIATEPDPIPMDVLDGVTTLLEQSLLRADEGKETTRYRMLETLRVFGQEQLAQAHEDEAVRSAHAEIVHECVDLATNGLSGPDAAQWSEAMEVEHDNLRAALRWTTETGRAATSLALVRAVWPFWETRGYLTEGRTWFDQVLALPSASPSPDRAEALAGAGVLARHQGDLTQATAFTEESLAVWRTLGDRRGEARSLRFLGVVADRQGDESRATTVFQQSLDLARHVGDEAGTAAALNSLGVVLLHTGQLTEARTMLEEALALERRIGQRARLPVPLNNLAILAIDAGHLAEGRAYLEESLAIEQELGHKSGVADTLENLGEIAYEEGNVAYAAQLYGDSLQIHRDLGDRFSVAYALENIAAVAAATGASDVAARLFGAAAGLREDIGAPIPQSEMHRFERGLANARAELSAAAFDAAWAAGRELSWMQAADEALELTQKVATATATSE